ncbi:hypothetical protein JTB14_002272 [Gonioctena quinquepunctata]|nr:hypothetical protein JTB14_002272 [Gonioctena quinquepunctata]
METIEKVYTFFNTPKRQQVLQHQVHSLLPESRSGKLKQKCPTRWIRRHDSFMIMVQLLKPVHVTLQEISLWKNKDYSSDLAFAMDKAGETISTIKYVRENAEAQFKNIFDEAKQIADMFDIEIKIPRLASKQTNRANVPAEGAMDYYRKLVFIPWID